MAADRMALSPHRRAIGGGQSCILPQAAAVVKPPARKILAYTTAR